jgi:hypothetical protein
MNTANPERGSDYLWQVLAPPAESQDNLPVPGATGEFLTELSEFRGRMLYANGRRPRFARKGGKYADNDPLDLESFHVTVRTDGALIGCIRVTPLPEYPRSFIGRQVGPSALERAAGMMTLARADYGSGPLDCGSVGARRRSGPHIAFESLGGGAMAR